MFENTNNSGEPKCYVSTKPNYQVWEQKNVKDLPNLTIKQKNDVSTKPEPWYLHT